MPAEPAPLSTNPALSGVRNVRREQRGEPEMNRYGEDSVIKNAVLSQPRNQQQATPYSANDNRQSPPYANDNRSSSRQPTLSTQTQSQFKIISKQNQQINPALAPTTSIRNAKRITALPVAQQPIDETFNERYANPPQTSAKAVQREVASSNERRKPPIEKPMSMPQIREETRKQRAAATTVLNTKKKIIVLGLQGLATTFYTTIQLPLALTSLTFLGISGGITVMVNDFFGVLNTITLGVAEFLVDSISSLFGDEISLSYIMIPAFGYMFIGGLLALLLTIFVILTLFLSGIPPFSGKGAVGKLTTFILSLFISFPVFNLVPWISIYLLVIRFTSNSKVD